jgi:hypothetical protein
MTTEWLYGAITILFAVGIGWHLRGLVYKASQRHGTGEDK